MTDEELLKATAYARLAAHEAPKNLFRNADGSGSLGNSRAWADRSNDWMRLADEVDRRGLKQPALADRSASVSPNPPKAVITDDRS